MTQLVILTSLALLAVAYLLKRMSRAGEAAVSLPVASACLISSAVIVGGALSAGPREPEIPLPSPIYTTRAAPSAGTALHAGAQAPEIQAAGWVNGPPKPVRGKRRPVRVVDVWAPWCLVCHEMAPGLVKVHDDYAARGVEFVSLTDMPVEAVESFVVSFGIPWPSGFGVPKATVDAYRALREGVQERDRQIAPILYVVGADGKVRWSDDNGRYRHEAVADVLAALREELDLALAASEGRTPS